MNMTSYISDLKAHLSGLGTAPLQVVDGAADEYIAKRGALKSFIAVSFVDNGEIEIEDGPKVVSLPLNYLIEIRVENPQPLTLGTGYLDSVLQSLFGAEVSGFQVFVDSFRRLNSDTPNVEMYEVNIRQQVAWSYETCS